MKFSWNQEIQVTVTQYFESLDESFFKTGIVAFENRWKKCIELGGDYVEK